MKDAATYVFIALMFGAAMGNDLAARLFGGILLAGVVYCGVAAVVRWIRN